MMVDNVDIVIIARNGVGSLEFHSVIHICCDIIYVIRDGIAPFEWYM